MRIYVGNLDYAVTSDELRALFEPFGAVTMAEVQVKSRTGQSRGFALVEMPNEREAEAAIAALNGQRLPRPQADGQRVAAPPDRAATSMPAAAGSAAAAAERRAPIAVIGPREIDASRVRR